MIITVTNQKGGTGKTTTAVNIAAFFARQKYKTLLIDLDPQSNATSGVGMYDRELPGIYEVMREDYAPEEVVRSTSFKHLDILPSTPDVAGLNVELVNREDREFILNRILTAFASNYDIVIMDTPPSLGLVTLNGLVASDYVLLPVQCEYYALEGLGQLMETVQLVREYVNDRLHVLGAVLTMHDRRNKISQQVAQDVRQNFPDYVFSTVIPRNVSLSEAPSFGKPIFQYAALSRGASAYKRLGNEIISQLQERSEEAESNTSDV